MINFREQNPVVVGAIGVAVIAVVLGLAVNTGSLLSLAGSSHSALFAEAGGLKAGDPVRVAGLDVGRVTDVALDGPDVRVDFKITDGEVRLGDQTAAAVSVATVLGDKFLKLTPTGTGELSDPIPRARTVAPYDLPEALSTLTDKAAAIDTPQLADALDTVSTTLEGKAPQLKQALDGVSRLSATISTRDASLKELLSRANGVTTVLADRAQQLKLLIGDGNLLLGELQERRQAIRRLLVNASAVAKELDGLVADNREQLGPTLDRLNSSLTVLQENEDNLTKIIAGAGDYATGLGEAVSNGPFFNAYVQNLIPGNLLPLSDFLPKTPALVDAPAEGGVR